ATWVSSTCVYNGSGKTRCDCVRGTSGGDGGVAHYTPIANASADLTHRSHRIAACSGYVGS
ncbi:unnamed protein product, partial [Brassica napus]